VLFIGFNRRKRRMSSMTRLRIALAAIALVGLSACGTQTPAEAELPAEAQALAAMGFDAALVPAEAPSGRPDRPLRARVLLRRNVLHGEAVVQTKDGQQTVAVQRGEVTAINDKSVTVKSADGFTQTWTFGNPLHVLEHRTPVQTSAIKVGGEVGVAGAKESGGYVAKLIAKR
jgi:hypothetical protein